MKSQTTEKEAIEIHIAKNNFNREMEVTLSTALKSVFAILTKRETYTEISDNRLLRECHIK